MNTLISIVAFVFEFSNRFVEVVGGVFASIINFFIGLIGQFCSWLVEVIGNSGELQGPIIFVLVVLGIMIACAFLVYSPYIIGFIFIIIPLLIWLLKMTLGWLLLIGMVYFVYKKLRQFVRWGINHLKAPISSVE